LRRFCGIRAGESSSGEEELMLEREAEVQEVSAVEDLPLSR
jgi:hypothetical protein